MQSNPNLLSNIIRFVSCALIAAGGLARAEEVKPTPAGTWIWVVPARNDGPDRTNTLTLKLEGDKLTGTLSMLRRNGDKIDTAIQDAKVTGEDISFTVVREFNGNTMTSKYSGKLSADTIKGKIDFERDGETQTRDWKATRQAVTAAAPAPEAKTDTATKK